MSESDQDPTVDEQSTATTKTEVNGHAHPPNAAAHVDEEEEEEEDIAPRPSWKKIDLDLDDAFSTGDEPIEGLSIAPVSFREMVESERVKEDGEGTRDEVDLTPRKSSFSHALRNGDGQQTPTSKSFPTTAQRMTEIDLNADDDDHEPAAMLDSISLSSSSPSETDEPEPPSVISVPVAGHKPNGSLGKSLRTPDLSTEFVDVSLESPASRRPSPTSTVPITASTVVSSGTTGSFRTPLTSLSSRRSADSTPVPKPDSQTSHSRSVSNVSSNGYTSNLDPKLVPRTTPPRHHPTRGPSALESVISKTRPPYLPPKPKAEDNKHLKDWSKMMAHARDAEEKRRREAEHHAMERERRMEESLHSWEHIIMPDIHAATRDKKLRKHWWDGVPPKLRGRVWAATIGNPLALSKDAYRPYAARARRALAADKFPRETLELIHEDVCSTLPSLRIFDPVHGPMHQDLKDLLYAWTVARGDEGLTYVRGASHVAGMLLINMPIEQAFIAFRNLLDRHLLRSFYAAQTDDVQAYYRIFDTLLADIMPKVYYNFQKHHVPPSLYLPDWIIPLFLLHLPFDACARLWDIILLEGDAFVFRAALGMLGVMEGRLYFPDHGELMEVLRGEDGTRGKGKQRETPLEGGRYERYGMTEEALFERIAAMDEMWKENTWTRLVTRELPDL